MAHTATTGAAAEYLGFQGFDEADHDYMIWIVGIKFNGPAPDIQVGIRFFRNAAGSVKQAAVRDAINEHLAFYEPGVTLTNANIQISGQPV